MRLALRRPKNGDTDYELMFGLLFLPLVAAFVFLVSRVPASLLPRCMLHTSFGIPCPTCGASRSMRLLTTGHPLESWVMQPLIVTLTAVGLLYCAYSFVVVLGKLPRIRIANISRNERKTIAFIAAILVLVNWLYLLLRGA